jgi:Cu+-exporting ATPase
MQVDERTAAGTSVFEGRSYYFCSAGCKKKFEANPVAYIGTPAANSTKRPDHVHPHAQATLQSPVTSMESPPSRPGRARSALYLPDAPEIVRDAPGHCPICGMALVPIGAGQAKPTIVARSHGRLWIGVALSIPLVVSRCR